MRRSRNGSWYLAASPACESDVDVEAGEVPAREEAAEVGGGEGEGAVYELHQAAPRRDRMKAAQESTVTFARITVNPEQMGGVPVIRGLRIPVATVVGMVADGMTTAEIVKAFPDLVEEDVREALRYAAEAVRERELPLSVGA